MHTLIIGSAAALALVLFAGPVLTQPAFAEAPNSVNVGGKNIGADPDANVRFHSVAMSEARVSDCRQRLTVVVADRRDASFGHSSPRCQSW